MRETISSAVVAERLEGVRRRRSMWRGMIRFIRKKPLGAAGAFVVVLLVLAAFFAPLIAPYDPIKQHGKDALTAPGSRYWLGSDNIGRDVFSRILYGARISLFISITAVFMGTLVGMLIGVVSGYFGGKLDFSLQRVMDTIMAFPLLILAIAIVAMLGSSLFNVTLAIAFVLIPAANRVVRGSTLSVKANMYVEAARAIGASNFRILALHVLPNVFAPVIVLVSIVLGAAILTETSLSFLGLGTPPPTPTWGGMLSGAGRLYMLEAPWLAIFPGAAISLTVLAVNLLGDALRDVLDPRLAQR